MAVRLILPSEEPLPDPNRNDDLESFWHVLLWIASQQCEHKLPLNRIITSLHELFDSMYVDETGHLKGGDSKLAMLTSQILINHMELGSRLLRRILVDAATILAARYLKSIEKEDQVLQIEKIWMAFQSENSQLQKLSELEDNIYFSHNTLYPTFSLWKALHMLQDVHWVAEIFETALNDPMSNWDAGGANIERSFQVPRNASHWQTQRRKRESDSILAVIHQSPSHRYTRVTDKQLS
jgi:hypothetical protein